MGQEWFKILSPSNVKGSVHLVQNLVEKLIDFEQVDNWLISVINLASQKIN
jgi:hypothetical protein